MWPHQLILCCAWVQCLSVLDHCHWHHLDLVNVRELAPLRCCAMAQSLMHSLVRWNIWRGGGGVGSLAVGWCH